MVSGSSYTALATMLAALPGDDAEILSAFSRNLDGRLLGGSGEVVGAVARGDFLVGVTLEETSPPERTSKSSTPRRAPAPCRTASRR